jgi:mannose/fructose/sorbose-specific phosphotransferase system IIA component
VINIVLIGHGGFPSGIESAVNMIIGAQEGFYSIPLLPEDSPESFSDRVEQVLTRVLENSEVLFAVDVKGGTHSNVAARYVSSKRRCVTGVNLPMVLDLVMNRYTVSTARELAETAVSAGTSGILDFSSEIDLMMNPKR